MSSTVLPRPPLRRGTAFPLALLLGALLAPSAHALPVFFEGPSGFGIGEENADGAFDAGFTRLTPEEITQPATLGISFLAPHVVGAILNDSPSPSNPNTATSVWTVQNPGEELSGVWLVFLKPLTYVPDLVGIDIRTGSWGVVEIASGGTEYFYPTVRLGTLPAGDAVQFTLRHVIGTEVVQQGATVALPQYGVGILTGVVPEPGVPLLLAALLVGLALRRGGTE